MTDAYWKKRAQEMPHHEPAHKTQNKSLDDALNSIPGMPPQVPANDGGALRQRPTVDNALAMRIAQLASQQPPPAPPQAPQAKVVFIKEGVRAYRQLEAQGYGSNMPLARLVGPVQGVDGREFEFKGIVQAYILEGDGPVDLANVNPAQIVKLAVVQAPFIGKLLIPESAVFSGGAPKRSLLKG